MARVTFSQTDILRAKLLPPGWYPLLVKKFEEQQAGTDGSALYVYELTVEGGPFAGVPLRNQISEKALGMGIEFLECCGLTVTPGVALELDKVVGKKLDGFVQRGEYKGKPNNQVVSFRLSKSEA